MIAPTHIHRHELKYYIRIEDYITARSLLSDLMDRDTHQHDEYGYPIRSLYFDTIDDAAVHEKLAGVETRDKYRIRIYDTKDTWAKLERKRKHNDYVDKTSTIITKDETRTIIDGSYDVLLSKDDAGARSIYYDLKRTFRRPVVVVDYLRDAFVLEYNQIRITFDHSLRTNTYDFDIFDDTLMTEPILRDEIIIMEVKFNHVLPPWLASIIPKDTATRSAISKYCHARMHTQNYYFT